MFPESKLATAATDGPSACWFVRMARLGISTERKLQKVLDGKTPFPYLNSMTNDFATINAESNLRDTITMSADEINEANAWFDERNAMEDAWLDAAYEARTEMDF